MKELPQDWLDRTMQTARAVASRIVGVRMLVMGSQLQFRNAHEIGPNGARKWIQLPYASRDAQILPTIVGEVQPLPLGEWEQLVHGIAITGLIELEGNPYYPAFHQPTWYLDIDLGDSRKRVKCYGAGAKTVLTEEEGETNADVWAFGCAVGAVEQFGQRVPWNERLEDLPVAPPPGQLDDLLDIGGPWVERSADWIP